MRITRRSTLRLGALCVAALMAPGSVLAAVPKVRVGVLKFGTVSWELDTVKHHALDTAAGIDLEVVPFAGEDATNVAMLAGEIDMIVSDWLWVSRQRSEGSDVTQVPYSTAVGAIMVKEMFPPPAAACRSLPVPGDARDASISVDPPGLAGAGGNARLPEGMTR